jgi:hypothetical protein
MFWFAGIDFPPPPIIPPNQWFNGSNGLSVTVP